jgi:two-component system, chemotaxis family, protein-glutamate methylesterase/glutaminase
MGIRVLIVDDSAVVRQAIEKELSLDPDITVVGTAPDPYVAREKIVELNPDVVTLDIEMPRMDGLSFLVKLMHYHPVPVIIVSSLAVEGSKVALEAVRVGAVDVVAKPSKSYSLSDMGEELREKVRAAAQVQMKSFLASSKSAESPVVLSRSSQSSIEDGVVLVGASTGGTQAIEAIVTALPESAPAMVIVQHMPAGFTKSFADRLNGIASMTVKEAEDGDLVEPGLVLVAPGNLHTVLVKDGNALRVSVKDGPLVGRHRPSVDVLFSSAAGVLGSKAIALLMSGMGKDGAQGMQKIKEKGGFTIAQDEASCVVFGMPKAAIELGAVNEVLPLYSIAERVLKLVGG